MNPQRVELLVQRGRLLERISQQRDHLARQIAPLAQAVSTVEHLLERARANLQHIQQHPQPALVAAAMFVLFGPKRAWRHARRGLLLWRSWRWLRGWLGRAGL
ncbi:MAG: hypothetical protein RL459_424 [Pseudomonadota bacterium]